MKQIIITAITEMKKLRKHIQINADKLKKVQIHSQITAIKLAKYISLQNSSSKKF